MPTEIGQKVGENKLLPIVFLVASRDSNFDEPLNV
jgi:hypothetical protein